MTLSPPAADSLDPELLHRWCQEHDEQAFATLVLRHQGLVEGTCRRILGGSHTCDDAIQATFLVLARRAPAIEATVPLGPWLHGVAWRCAQAIARQERRRSRRESHVVRDLPSATRPATPEDGDLLQALERELFSLPPIEHTIVVLCQLQGLSHVEAAKATGIPVGSVSRHLARALGRLRERLQGRGFQISACGALPLLGQPLVTTPTIALQPLALAKGTASPSAGQAAATVLRSALPAWLALACAIAIAIGVTVMTMRLLAPGAGPARASPGPIPRQTVEARMAAVAAGTGWIPLAERMVTGDLVDPLPAGLGQALAIAIGSPRDAHAVAMMAGLFTRGAIDSASLASLSPIGISAPLRVPAAGSSVVLAVWSPPIGTSQWAPSTLYRQPGRIQLEVLEAVPLHPQTGGSSKVRRHLWLIDIGTFPAGSLDIEFNFVSSLAHAMNPRPAPFMTTRRSSYRMSITIAEPGDTAMPWLGHYQLPSPTSVLPPASPDEPTSEVVIPTRMVGRTIPAGGADGQIQGLVSAQVHPAAPEPPERDARRLLSLRVAGPELAAGDALSFGHAQWIGSACELQVGCWRREGDPSASSRGHLLLDLDLPIPAAVGEPITIGLSLVGYRDADGDGLFESVGAIEAPAGAVIRRSLP